MNPPANPLAPPAAKPGPHPAIPPHFTAMAIALPAILLGLEISGWIGFLAIIRNGHADFRNLYTAGYMLRTGHGPQIYDYAAQKAFQDAQVSPEAVALPFIRPAYQALLFAPFSLLPFHAAYVAFLLLNLALLYGCYRLLRPHLADLQHLWPPLPAAIFLFLPITAALMQGQDSVLLLVLVAGAWVSLTRGQESRAGALLALGLFKFQLVLPLALLFLLWRRWRFCGAFAAVATLLAAVSVAITGTGSALAYAGSLLQMGASRGLASGLPLPVTYMANLHGAVWGMLGMLGGSALVTPVTLALSLIVLVAAAWRRPAAADALLLAIPVSSLVSYYLFIHDMSLLLLPIAFVASRTVADWVGGRPDPRALGAAALLFIAPGLMSFAAEQFWLVTLPLLLFTAVLLLPRPASHTDPLPAS